ncbi:DNA polymerase III subunit beta [Elioraea tepida]|jgi:DNA polymerase-3 subunit beta|uniref:Beta sliding clamp n=1 Tax=Elioraea tepida TaxID=2843330 RepID=A0A975YIM8_9PROT|nr:DNA polymerase III subunit beta [Elioraea tepida]QXM23754.1 DNA polymerase III subunit beta [Elioraea tepida]
MKIKVERSALMKALSHVQNVVERRNTIPILANVLLRAKDGVLTLAATDMEIAAVEQVPADILKQGATTAPAATLYEIVRKLPEGATIELDHPGGDAQLALRSGRFATSLVCLPVEDFPALQDGVLPHRFGLKAGTLRELIDRTRFAISTEETRYYLNGIYLHVTESDGVPVLRAVATDGHRLARVEEDLPEGAAGMPGVIVPRKAVLELRKLLDDVPGQDLVEIALSDTKIRFAFGPVTLTSKLIDGTFPDYERVIPRDNDKLLRIPKRDFAEAVDRVAAISSERSRPVKLAIAKQGLTLSAASPEQGTASEEIDADRVEYDAPPIEIGFQARYLRDITDQMADGTRVEFKFHDGAAPTLIRAEGDPRAVYVLMPMRV